MDIMKHYDLLIEENNDPVLDPPSLQEYMNKWDGEEFIAEMQLNCNKTVLEVGVGTGRLALRVLPNCHHFTGIDISPKTIQRAKHNLAGHVNTTLICSDFSNYEFKSKFDVVYSSLTFLHIKDKQKAISKVSKILEPNGTFILSISKEKSTELNFDTRKLRLYPDNLQDILHYLTCSNLMLMRQIEIEFAWIIVATTRKWA